MLEFLILGTLLIVRVQGAPEQIANKYDGKIINGTDAESGQYPYQISLQSDRFHFCGGFILTSTWIGTAGHCLREVEVQSLTVLAGTIYLSEGGERRNVEKFIQHENFDPSSSTENDIALVKVTSPFEFNSFIQPINLPEPFAEVPGGTPVTVTGWGTLETGGSSPDILQAVDIFTVTDDECSTQLNVDIFASEICAGLPEGNKGICHGDSGGALQTNGVVVGIVSWTYSPCTKPPNQYAVHAQVSHFIDWINLKIQLG